MNKTSLCMPVHEERSLIFPDHIFGFISGPPYSGKTRVLKVLTDRGYACKDMSDIMKQSPFWNECLEHISNHNLVPSPIVYRVLLWAFSTHIFDSEKNNILSGFPRDQAQAELVATTGIPVAIIGTLLDVCVARAHAEIDGRPETSDRGARSEALSRDGMVRRFGEYVYDTQPYLSWLVKKSKAMKIIPGKEPGETASYVTAYIRNSGRNNLVTNRSKRGNTEVEIVINKDN